MVESCDAGSLPFFSDLKKFLAGAVSYGQVANDSTQFFENNVVAGFIDKLSAGIDVPNYPQHRDMTQMFIDVIEGLEKVNGGYIETAPLTVKKGREIIPEALAVKNRARDVHERLDEPFQLRICITGPYTLASVFAFKDKGTFTRLGNVLEQIIEATVFNTKHGSVKLVSIDDPVFGFVDDPLLDRGSEGRENLLKAWESMMRRVKTKGAQTCLHLHNTSNELFWEAKALDIVESHVNDPFYQAKRTKELLQSTDKFVKASVAVTDFDQLIRNHITATSETELNETVVNEKIAETWKNLTKKQVDPAVFLESAELIKHRLDKITEFFGENRIPYAGPECGLKSFPTYESALECLKRVSEAVQAS